MENISRLKQLFKPDFSHLSASTIRDFEATEEVQQLRLMIDKELSGKQWEGIRSEIFTQAEHLLDINLHSILVKSWKTHHDVQREARLQQESNSNNIAIVTLADHEIRTTHSPYLVARITDPNAVNLRFFIGVVLKLKDVSLKIQAGEVKEIISGTISGNGFMQYQNATLVEKDFLGFGIEGVITHDELSDSHSEQGLSLPQHLSTENGATPPSPSKPTSSFQKNIVQFIVGISLAMLAVFIFWQFNGA